MWAWVSWNLFDAHVVECDLAISSEQGEGPVGRLHASAEADPVTSWCIGRWPLISIDARWSGPAVGPCGMEKQADPPR